MNAQFRAGTHIELIDDLFTGHAIAAAETEHIQLDRVLTGDLREAGDQQSKDHYYSHEVRKHANLLNLEHYSRKVPDVILQLRLLTTSSLA